MKKLRVGIAMGLGILFVLANHALAVTETAAVTEYGIILTQEGFFPDNIYTSKNLPSKFWIANASTKQITLSFDNNQIEQVKPNAIQEITFENGLAESTQLKADGQDFQHAASINLNERPVDQPVELALLGAKKQFLPNNTVIPAEIPLKIGLFSIVGFPHKDFILFNTTIKLPFQNKKFSTIEVKEGLKAGSYAISRPGHPKQNHKITSKITVIKN